MLHILFFYSHAEYDHARPTHIHAHTCTQDVHVFITRCCSCISLFLTVADCGNLTNPTNGQVSTTAGTTEGQTATYSCNTGYNLVGDGTRTCGANGNWSGSEPTCERMLLLNNLPYKYAHNVFLLSTAVDCNALSDPSNGQVSHTAGTTFGQTATYSCNTGYNLVGDSTRTCEAAGEWSGSEPTCQRTFLYLLTLLFV